MAGSAPPNPSNKVRSFLSEALLFFLSATLIFITACVPSPTETPTPTPSPASIAELPDYFPGQASDRMELPLSAPLNAGLTLGQLAHHLTDAVSTAGYAGEYSFYCLRANDGPGFAIIISGEHIHDDATPVMDDRGGFELPRYKPGIKA